MTRRQFLAVTGASTAALALGCGGGGGSSRAPGSVDVVVIGAGVAGMSAGMALKEAGKSFVILEAQNRVGGRVFSNNDFPVPFDYGAQLFQQCVPIGEDPMVTRNPLFNMAVKQRAAITPAFTNQALIKDGAPLSLEESLAVATATQLVEQTIDDAGKAAAMSGAGDLSVRAATSGLSSIPYYDYALLAVEADRGRSAEDISSEDLYQYSRWTTSAFGQPSTDNWFIRTGMGNYVAQLAAGLPIQFGTPVTSVDYSGRGVRVMTPGGVIEARAVIVTASMGVLNAGKISFTPNLPPDYTAAFANLGMGAVGKIGFEFDADIFTGMTDNLVLGLIPPDGSNAFAGMFAKFFGKNMCYVITGGPICEEAERVGEEGLIALGREVVGGVFGADVLSRVTRTACHSWLNDPWAFGAYTTATPGHVRARTTLQTPIDEKVFFAGEGVALEGGASMGGAYITGRQAVKDYLGEGSALKALRKL